MRRRSTLASLGALIASPFPVSSWAQAHAPRLQRFLVGYPAGGAADFVARVTVDALQAGGLTMIVENRPGAGGNLAMEHLVRLPADAATFGVFPNSMFTTNPYVAQLAMKSVDVSRDLVPVAAVADLVLALAVSTQSGIGSLDEFLARARSSKEPLRLGVPVMGSPHHLSGLLLERTAGLNVTLVVYKGGAQVVMDAAGGHLDAIFTSVPVAGPLVASGKLKWIAIVQPKPVASLPGVPSLVEVFKGATIPSWIGVWAPSTAPAESIAAMNAAINSATATAALSQRLRDSGMEPLGLPRPEIVRRLGEEGRFMKDFLDKVKVNFQA